MSKKEKTKRTITFYISHGVYAEIQDTIDSEYEGNFSRFMRASIALKMDSYKRK